MVSILNYVMYNTLPQARYHGSIDGVLFQMFLLVIYTEYKSNRFASIVRGLAISYDFLFYSSGYSNFENKYYVQQKKKKSRNTNNPVHIT